MRQKLTINESPQSVALITLKLHDLLHRESMSDSCARHLTTELVQIKCNFQPLLAGHLPIQLNLVRQGFVGCQYHLT
jgi:hypothetical protein